jgi:hypothetical protein
MQGQKLGGGGLCFILCEYAINNGLVYLVGKRQYFVQESHGWKQ